MLVAWLVTLPAAALVGGLAASVVQYGGDAGTAIVALVGVTLASGIVAVSRRNPVHAHNVNDTHEVTIGTAAPAKVGTAV
jgi:PiT family inorganic phosphate transporter